MVGLPIITQLLFPDSTPDAEQVTTRGVGDTEFAHCRYDFLIALSQYNFTAVARRGEKNVVEVSR